MRCSLNRVVAGPRTATNDDSRVKGRTWCMYWYMAGNRVEGGMDPRDGPCRKRLVNCSDRQTYRRIRFNTYSSSSSLTLIGCSGPCWISLRALVGAEQLKICSGLWTPQHRFLPEVATRSFYKEAAPPNTARFASSGAEVPTGPTYLLPQRLALPIFFIHPHHATTHTTPHPNRTSPIPHGKGVTF